MRSPAFCSRKTLARLHSFTLVEMLVSLGVFSLMMVIMAQMTAMVDNAWRQGESRVDNFTRARAILDVVAQDIQRGVFRPDLPAFAPTSASIYTNGMMVLQNSGATTNAFYTRRAGVGANMREISLVVYTLDASTNGVLQRADYAIPWSTPSTWANCFAFQTGLSNVLSQSSGTFRDACEGVVDFNLIFRLADGTSTSTYGGYSSNPVTAVGIGLAVVDEQTMKVLQSTSKFGQLQTDLKSALTGTNSIKADWDAKLATPNYYNNYPKDLGPGLKTFERYVTVEPGF